MERYSIPVESIPGGCDDMTKKQIDSIDAFCLRHAEVLDQMGHVDARRREMCRLNEEKRELIYELESKNKKLEEQLELAMVRIHELEWQLKEQG